LTTITIFISVTINGTQHIKLITFASVGSLIDFLVIIIFLYVVYSGHVIGQT